jgi:gamma-glutamyltranspeptidase / glutathione hydrolase
VVSRPPRPWNSALTNGPPPGGKWWASPFPAVTHGTGPPAVASRGMVATSNPLAGAAALQILEAGGSAADAAVAADAVSGVVDSHLTGIGGDCAVLVYDPAEKTYAGLNATGPAPMRLDREAVLAAGERSMPAEGPLSVTVPGAVAGWAALLQRFGRLPLSDLLQPAIEHARRGFPLAPVTSAMWRDQVTKLRRHPHLARDILVNGDPPGAAELRRAPRLAETLSTLAATGPASFYRGPIGRSLCQTIERGGGVLTPPDLEAFTPEWVTPLSVQYERCRIFELPPNTQGPTVFFALRVLQEHIDAHGSLPPWGSTSYVALLAQAISRALTMRDTSLADPASMTTSVQDLLASAQPAVAAERHVPNSTQATDAAKHPGDTVYIAVADETGLMVSFISSIFAYFGSGVLDTETGIILQNRAAAFRLDSSHVQRLVPGRRPLHTIIPAAAELSSGQRLSLGLTGADMQPQGQLQVLCNLINFRMNLQEALDAPRIRIQPGNILALEGSRLAGLRQSAELSDWKTQAAESLEMGSGQLILHDPEDGVLVGATERRRDGCVLGR